VVAPTQDILASVKGGKAKLSDILIRSPDGGSYSCNLDGLDHVNKLANVKCLNYYTQTGSYLYV
jgi:hypothetical protein